MSDTNGNGNGRKAATPEAPWAKESISVVVARFPQERFEHVDVTDYLIGLAHDLATDPLVAEVYWWKTSDTPVTMCRNRAAEFALEKNADLLLMVDNDMSPDRELKEGDPNAKPFWETSLKFWLERRRSGKGPCIVGAPYCASPPHEQPLVCRWRTQLNDHPDPEFQMKLYTREESLYETGITRVAGLPTGLMLTDVDAFRSLPHPYFYYEWADQKMVEKQGTEDITFTRDCDFAGVPLYCNWDAWAGHWKLKCVRKPRPLPIGAVPWKLREALVADEAVRAEIGKRSRLAASTPSLSAVPGDALRTG